ncbi:hypothetical protein L204_100203 [Cryptococcus depauperatus]
MSTGNIDERFHTAVDIVQSLPKQGPIQTSYEEKLWLYSLYKQAMEGDINIPRPGMLDLLGKSKWDSWNKQRGIDKDEAKILYVKALLNLLKKNPKGEGIEGYIQKLGLFIPRGSQSEDPPRPLSPASSTSSYHSSQASPHTNSQSQQYLPPDPKLPPPDVAPSIIPPSALNSSHRSLLSLHQLAQEQAETYSGLGPLKGTLPGSKTQSMKGSAEYRVQENRPESVYSFRQRSSFDPRARLGSPQASQFGIHQTQPIPRDFSQTPDMHTSPYFGSREPTSVYPRRPGSTSTFSQPPALNISYTLQQIQTSLIALHERLSTLEKAQAMLLRKDERGKSWFVWASEDEDIDQFEDDATRERYGGIGVNTMTRVERRKYPLSLGLIWFVLRTLRRAVVDVGVGMTIIFVWFMVLNGGWKRTRWVIGRLWGRWSRMMKEA